MELKVMMATGFVDA